MSMSININLVMDRYRCLINNKYTVVVTLHRSKDTKPLKEPRIEFYEFFFNGDRLKGLPPDLDENKVKERIIKLITSIENPFNKGEGVINDSV